MKKILICIAIVALIVSIVFVPAILNVSSTIKLKNLKNKIIQTDVNSDTDSGELKSQKLQIVKENSVKKIVEKEGTKEVTFVSLNPLEEIEWLMQNIYIEDLDEERDQVINKDITQIQWENIKNDSVTSTLRNIVNSVDKLLNDVPKIKVLTPNESAKLRNLMIKYQGSVEFLLKQGTRNVSAKESLAIVLNSYNTLIQYINNLQVAAKIKGLNFDFNVEDIKFEKFFENKNISKVIESDDNFLKNTEIYLKRVTVREEDGKKSLGFDVEITGKDMSRLEVFNQYGLYESKTVNSSSDKTETRQFSFYNSYPAKGIYVIKVISQDGRYYYKRYIFYPRVTLFALEHNEYKLPFSYDDYKKLDEFFQIKIIKTRMNSKFIDREFVTSF